LLLFSVAAEGAFVGIDGPLGEREDGVPSVWGAGVLGEAMGAGVFFAGVGALGERRGVPSWGAGVGGFVAGSWLWMVSGSWMGPPLVGNDIVCCGMPRWWLFTLAPSWIPRSVRWNGFVFVFICCCFWSAS